MNIVYKARQKGKTEELIRILGEMPEAIVVVPSVELRCSFIERIMQDQALANKVQASQIIVASPNCLRSTSRPVLVDDAECVLEMLMCGNIGSIDTITLTDNTD